MSANWLLTCRPEALTAMRSLPRGSMPGHVQAASWQAASRSAHLPRSQMRSEASATGMKSSGRTIPWPRSVPAHQRFEAHSLTGGERDDGLVVQLELALDQPNAASAATSASSAAIEFSYAIA